MKDMPNKIVIGHDTNVMSVGHGQGDNSTNTAVGLGVLANVTSALYNTSVGTNSLLSNQSGGGNTAVGADSLSSTVSGAQNVAVGFRALQFAVDANNTAVGYYSMRNTTSGVQNTAVGSHSLLSNTTGYNNVSVGLYSMTSNLSGNDNVAIGVQSMYKCTIGGGNVAVGPYSLFEMTSNYANTAIGTRCLMECTAGYNTGVGSDSFRFCTTGSNNAGFGESALQRLTTGSGNTAVGQVSLLYTTAGSYFNYSGCSGLGYDTRCSGNNQVQLGDSTTTTYAYGAVQNRSDARDKTNIVDETLGLDFLVNLRPVQFQWNYREKYFDEVWKPALDMVEVPLSEGTYPLISGTETIGDLRVSQGNVCTIENATTWTDKTSVPSEAMVDDTTIRLRAESSLVAIPNDGSRSGTRYHHGLIAQEVKQTVEQMGLGDFAGLQHHAHNGNGEDVYSIGYEELIAPLIKAVQELKSKNDAQQVRLDAMESRLAALES